jgi:hypothetical protein
MQMRDVLPGISLVIARLCDILTAGESDIPSPRGTGLLLNTTFFPYLR